MSTQFKTQLNPATRQRLLAFGRRRKTLIVWRGICVFLVSTLGIMAVVALLDAFFVLPDIVRVVMSLIAYASVAGLFWHFCLSRLLKQPDLRELARMFEERYDELKEEVLSAVELGEDDHNDESSEFRAILQEDVASRIKPADMRSLLPANMIKKWFVAAAVVGGIILLFSVIPGFHLPHRLARAFIPLANLERISDARITIIEPADPETLVALGDPLPIVVDVEGAEADHVFLECFARKEGKTRLRMDAIGIRENETGDGDGDSGGSILRYSALLVVGSDELWYRVRAGAAITKKFHLRSATRPHVQEFEKTIHPPEYTGLSKRSSREENGNIEALRGSRAELLIHTDQAIQRGSLKIETKEGSSTIPLEIVKPRLLKGAIDVEESGAYRVELVSKDTGFENKFSPNYELQALADLAPRANIESPRDNKVVPANEMLSLLGMASDDLGLKKVVQQYRINQGGWRTIPIEEDSGERAVIEEDWDLKPLNLKPGDNVFTKLVATDLKGTIGESLVLKLTISTPDFSAEMLEQGQEEQDFQDALDWLFQAAQDLKREADALKKMYDARDVDKAEARRQILSMLTKAQETEARAEEAWDSFMSTYRGKLDKGQTEFLIYLGRGLSRARHYYLLRTISELSRIEADPMLAYQRQQVAVKYARDLEHSVRQLYGAHANLRVVEDARNIRDALTRLKQKQNELAEKIQQAKKPELRERLSLQQKALMQEQTIVEGLVKRLISNLPGHRQRDISRQLAELEKTRGEIETLADEGKLVAEIGKVSRNLEKQLADFMKKFEKYEKDALKNLDNSSWSMRRLARRTSEDMKELRETFDKVLKQEEKITELEAADVKSRIQIEDERRKANLYRDRVDDLWRGIIELLADRADLEEMHGRYSTVFVKDNTIASGASEAVYQRGTGSDEKEMNAIIHKIEEAYNTLEGGHFLQSAKLDFTKAHAREFSIDKDKDLARKVAEIWDDARGRMSYVERDIVKKSFFSNEIREGIRDIFREEMVREVGKEMEQRRKKDKVGGKKTEGLDETVRLVGRFLPLTMQPMKEAREYLQSLMPPLTEQLREIAEKAKELREKTEEQAQQTEQQDKIEAQDQARELEQQQEELNDLVEQVRDTLRREANAQDLTDPEGLERARDADDALALLREPPPAAERALEEAVEEDNAQERREDLEEAAQEQENLANAAEQIAHHFENVENNMAEETRDEMRQVEEEMGIQEQLDQQYQMAQQLADMENRSPAIMQALLESALQNNPMMQQELQEIVDETVQEALQNMEQVVEDETEIDQELEDAAELDNMQQERNEIEQAEAEQQEVNENVNEITMDLERMATHAQQMQMEQAQDMQENFEQTREMAQQEMPAAQEALERATQAEQPQPQVEAARDAAQEQLQDLGELAEAIQAPEFEPQNLTEELTNAVAEQMAVAYDELMAAQQMQQPQSPKAQQAMQQAMQMQQQAMAQMRMEMETEDGEAQIEGELGDASRLAKADLEDREWGELRSRESKDLLNTKKEAVAEEYRPMVSKYFEVIAKKAKEQRQ
ncbi:MAG: hypothetical protein ACLFUS_05995 [Candidatus Sumerlaeia bacterium]